MAAKRMTFDEMAGLYCERQEQTPEGLRTILQAQKVNYPDVSGWFLGEAQLLDSSWAGSLVIVPYGPSNTFTDVPAIPFSPRGLASDTSVAIGYMPVDDLN